MTIRLRGYFRYGTTEQHCDHIHHVVYDDWKAAIQQRCYICCLLEESMPRDVTTTVSLNRAVRFRWDISVREDLPTQVQISLRRPISWEGVYLPMREDSMYNAQTGRVTR
jgi:hypothetical protein